MTSKLIFLILIPVLAAPAAASVTVFGNSSARLCYEAADSPLPSAVTEVRECDKALRDESMTPHDIVATYVNRGILLLRRGEMQAALSDFDAAIVRDPAEPEAYLNKAGALLRQPSNAATALPLFTAAIDHNTSKPALAHYGRGLSYELMGDVKSAYFDYKRASELDPQWDKPQEELARFTVRDATP